MPRIARLCAIGYPHHITQRGNDRQAVFFSDRDRRFYLSTLEVYRDEWDLEIWAWCLMPNHIHILAVPRKEYCLAKAIGTTNLVYTQYINRHYERSGRLWQNRFFSTIVEKESYLWAVARYIERNPLRAGIVQRPEEYAWSSARAHVLGVRDDLLSSPRWLDETQIEAYRGFLATEDESILASIRRATSSGRPLGTREFAKGLEAALGRNVIPGKPGRPKRLPQGNTGSVSGS